VLRPGTALSFKSRSASSNSRRISSLLAVWLTSHPFCNQTLKLTIVSEDEDLRTFKYFPHEGLPLTKPRHYLLQWEDRRINFAVQIALRLAECRNDFRKRNIANHH